MKRSTIILVYLLLIYPVGYRAMKLTKENVNVFSTLTDNKLVIFTIRGDLITKISENTFRNFTFLNAFTMNNQRVSVIQEKLFKYNTGVQEMALQENHIEKIHENAFSTLRKLKILYLNDNLLEIIPEKLFANNSLLETIFLHRNRIRTIYPKTLTHLQDFKVMSFSFNQIDYIDFSHNKNLEIINVFSNNLTTFPQINREKFPYLMELGMTGNMFNCSYASTLVNSVKALSMTIYTADAGNPTHYLRDEEKHFLKVSCVKDIVYKAQVLRLRIRRLQERLERLSGTIQKDMEGLDKVQSRSMPRNSTDFPVAISIRDKAQVIKQPVAAILNGYDNKEQSEAAAAIIRKVATAIIRHQPQAGMPKRRNKNMKSI